LTIILQFYALSFLLLGLLVLVWPKQETQYSIAKILWLLGAFGLTHSLVEWIELWRELRMAEPVMDAIQPFTLLVSYCFLFEFGRRLVLVTLNENPTPWQKWLLGPWSYVATLAFLFLGASLSDNMLLVISNLSRYIFGFIGALLASFGFLRYWQHRVRSHVQHDQAKLIGPAYYLLSISLLAYAVLGGLVVNHANWFPASVLNGRTFLQTTHIPVELARALCAILMAIAISLVLKMFNAESGARLAAARAASERGEASFKHASRQYETLLRTASDGIHILDMNGNVVEANNVFCRMLGYSRDEILGMNVHEWDAFFSPEELKNRVPLMLDRLSVFETRHRRRDGSIFDVEISTVGVHLNDTTYLYCSSRDITSRKQVETQLKLIAQVFDHVTEGVMITDDQKKILVINKAFTTLTGYGRKEVVGKTPTILKSDKHDDDFYSGLWNELQKDGTWRGTAWITRKNGIAKLTLASISTIRNESGNITNYIVMLNDVNTVKDAEQDMPQQ